jgi:copper transport protein
MPIIKSTYLSRIANLGLILAILLLLFCASPTPVQAHAYLERSDPPDNTELEQAPSQARLWFSEPVALNFTSVQLLDVTGQAVPNVSLGIDAKNPRLVVVSLPPLKSGIYSLNWKVLSASDGHDTLGLLVFGINASPAGLTGAAAATVAPDPIQVAVRALLDIALCGLFGALVITLALLAKPLADTDDGALQAAAASYRWRAVNWALCLAGLAIFAGIAQWLVQVTTSTGKSLAELDWPDAVNLLVSTSWGQFWLSRQVLLLGVLGLLFARRRAMQSAWHARDWAATALLAAAALFTYALTTHAAGLSSPLLPLLADFLHILSAGLWSGGLIALLVILLPVLGREPGSRQFFQSTWERFGRFAALAVGLTLATGLFNASGLVASLSALTGSAYGQTLALKVGLVLLVGLFGLANSLVLHPRLAAPFKRLFGLPAGWKPFDRSRLPVSIAIEALLGLLVFTLAGLVASNPPANTPEYRYVGIAQADEVTQRSGDLQVSLSVLPNLPGQNIIDIHAESTRQPPPADILRVILRMTYQGEELGTQSIDADVVEPGLYRLGGNYLSLPGPWKLVVVVRRKGVNDSLASFQWNVVPDVSTSLGIDANLQAPLWLASGLLLLLTLGLAYRLFLWRADRPGSSALNNPTLKERLLRGLIPARGENKPK